MRMVRSAWSTGLLLAGVAVLEAQPSGPDLNGMWSDPPLTLEDSLCSFYCSDTKIDHLLTLLDDPANDERPLAELTAEAGRHENRALIEPRLSASARETYPLDPADDPGFLSCEPWGFARQVFAPHQLEIQQYDDRVEMRYGEWEAHRTIYLDGREPPANAAPSLLGFSQGRYEGDTLVIETTAVRSNLMPWRSEHSDELEAVERYRRSDDGSRLLLQVTLQDPLALTAPVPLKKVWSWAPDQAIYPYDQCEPPAEFRRRDE